MATPALDANGLARLTLREISREHGPAGLDSAPLLTTLLPDLLPGAPRENRLIIAAAQLGVAGLLASRVSLGMPVVTAINDVASRLAQDTALDADASRWVVTEYAYVLGYGPDPRTAIDGGVPSQRTEPAQPLASPGAPPFVPPVAPTAIMPPPPPTGSRRGLVIAAAVVAVLVVAASVTYGLTRGSGKKNNGGSSAPCVVGTWTESTEFIRVDDSGNLTDDSSGTKLTRTAGRETRVYNADHTGTISLDSIVLEGDTSDGHHVAFFYDEANDGTFKWAWDGSTVTYSEVDLPGSFRAEVDGSTVAQDDSVNPLYDNGDADLTCGDDTLVQSGTGYERDYARG